jgi:hypothetical protein
MGPTWTQLLAPGTGGSVKPPLRMLARDSSAATRRLGEIAVRRPEQTVADHRWFR